VNDNPPNFVPSNIYRARISEASQPGVEVKQVLASDSDKNTGFVRYYIVYDTPESQAFEIVNTNRLTGVITLREAVDHEAGNIVNVTVRAEDTGVPPLTSLATVIVEVEDVNDNSPEWTLLPTPVWVWENATSGVVVTTVSAVDADSGRFGSVRYYITSGGNDKFNIDPVTVSMRNKW